MKLVLRDAGALGKTWPPVVRILLDHYLRNSKAQISFAVNALPVSLNNQYFHGHHFALKPEVKTFRAMVGYALGPQKLTWTKGIKAGVFMFESPDWVKKDGTARAKDVDNLLKPVQDAIQECTMVPDDWVWAVHAFKIQSKRTRTLAYCFDMGDDLETYE